MTISGDNKICKYQFVNVKSKVKVFVYGQQQWPWEYDNTMCLRTKISRKLKYLSELTSQKRMLGLEANVTRSNITAWSKMLSCYKETCKIYKQLQYNNVLL